MDLCHPTRMGDKRRQAATLHPHPTLRPGRIDGKLLFSFRVRVKELGPWPV